jgi:hypothetical protein
MTLGSFAFWAASHPRITSPSIDLYGVLINHADTENLASKAGVDDRDLHIEDTLLVAMARNNPLTFQDQVVAKFYPAHHGILSK